MSIKIAASILSADFSRLGEQVRDAIDGGADYIHVDVMDGHFVPNITVGPLIVSAIHPIAQAARQGAGIPLDVHLMVEHPEWMIADFAKAGAGMITVHVETCAHLHRTIQQIKELGVRAGVTLNPATPIIFLQEILPEVDQVLIMSVNPGFGGQGLLPGIPMKISRLRRMLDERGLNQVELEVDGGIKVENAAEIAAAGATVLVVGSAVFNDTGSVADNITALRNVL